MDYMALVIDFFEDLEKLGPGDNEQSKKALDKVYSGNGSLKILDLGCGTGAQTIFLAKETKSEIIAVDFLQPFLDSLVKKAHSLGLNVKTICSSMDSLSFDERSFDIIWSEGAIYNIGFDYGINYLKKYLKPNGYLVISEMSWFTDSRPDEIMDYWKDNYSEIDTVGNKLRQLLNAGYKVVDHFPLPNYCWNNYYEQMENKEKAFLEKHQNKEAVIDFVNEQVNERKMHKKYSEYYGYEFYIVQNVK